MRTLIHPHVHPAYSRVILFSLLLLLLFGCNRFGGGQENELGLAARVSRIVDGDTIEVRINGDSATVRYIGIDTPERGQPGYQAATEANRDLVEGQTVYLRRDTTERDVFGRLLRYVLLADGTMVNQMLIAEGWAQPVEYPPDIAYTEVFRRAARLAYQNEAGFWSGDSDYDGAMSYGIVERAGDMRRGPGTDYAITREVVPGEVLTIFGRSPNSRWLQVRLSDRTGGWLSVYTVEANVPVGTIPLGEVDGVVLIEESGTNAGNSGSVTDRCPDGCEIQPDPTCFIKGNVNSRGEKIYHLPGSGVYRRTQIQPDEGDRWFCTTRTAESNGFRAALR